MNFEGKRREGPSEKSCVGDFCWSGSNQQVQRVLREKERDREGEKNNWWSGYVIRFVMMDFVSKQKKKEEWKIAGFLELVGGLYLLVKAVLQVFLWDFYPTLFLGGWGVGQISPQGPQKLPAFERPLRREPEMSIDKTKGKTTYFQGYLALK